jgi:serine/threonine protein kinase
VLPQKVKSRLRRERTTKIDFDKCNAYRLGILLLHCLSLADPLALCYSPSMTSISPSSIRALINKKVAPNYSSEIVKLLSRLLREDPGRRPTLEEVYEEHSSKFSPYFELKVYGIRANDSNQSNRNDEAVSLSIQKKGSDFSDAKTVKYNHSARKN